MSFRDKKYGVATIKKPIVCIPVCFHFKVSPATGEGVLRTVEYIPLTSSRSVGRALYVSYSLAYIHTWNAYQQALHCCNDASCSKSLRGWHFKPVKNFHLLPLQRSLLLQLCISALTLLPKIGFFRFHLPTYTCRAHNFEIPCIICLLFLYILFSYNLKVLVVVWQLI